MHRWCPLIFIVITATRGQSFNQPALCLNASWDPLGITVANNSTIEGLPNTIFIDQKNTIYLTSDDKQWIQSWTEGNYSQRRNIANGLNQSQGLVVSANGNIFVDNGLFKGRLERWNYNQSNGTNVMNIDGTCFSLFLASNDTLYCSLSNEHQVIRKSLQHPLTNATRVAGRGLSGSLPSMLHFPRGIFVDSKMNLYVADSLNDRIQFFPFGQTNGTTVAGNGTPDNLILRTPVGILLDADESLFILEQQPGRILRLGTDYYRCLIGCTIPIQSNGLSTFQFDTSANLFLLDRRNIRIVKFLLTSNSCGPSSNLPRLSPCATWKKDAITVANRTNGGYWPDAIFVDRNNTLYASSGLSQSIQMWSPGGVVQSRNLSANSTWARSIFVHENGDVYLDNGDGNHRVEHWIANSTTASVTAMEVEEMCFGLFVDRKENLYCSIFSRHYVKRRSLMESINRTTIAAGNGTPGSASNRLNQPRGIVLDFNLNLFVADSLNNRVLRFAHDQLNGTVIVGYGSTETIDLQCPSDLALDAQGYLFISEYCTDRILGSGPNGFRCLMGCSRVSGSASNQLAYPISLNFDADGNLFVADWMNGRIQKFLLARNTCNVSFHQPMFCDNATWNSLGMTIFDNSSYGSITAGVFIGVNDTMSIASPSRQQVQVWLKGSTVPNLVIQTSLKRPSVIFVTIDRDIVMDDGGNHSRVERWIMKNNTLVPAMNLDDLCLSFFVDVYDRLYCSLDRSARVIRNSLLDNINLTERVAGNGTPGSAAHMLSRPRGIFVDLSINLYVADCGNDRVQRFARDETIGTTVAGNGSSGTIDLRCPTGVILDGNGYLFITDSRNDRIVASGPNGFRCLLGCGQGTGALNSPRTLQFDSNGSLLVMDSPTGRLRKFLFLSNSCDASTPMSTEDPSSSSSSSAATQTNALSIVSGVFLPASCSNGSMTGSSCNIPLSRCHFLHPCLNGGTCIDTNLTKSGYICQCLSQFNGSECQWDHRPCQPNTCWNEGICSPTVNQSFLCRCTNGWEGDHCEREVNLCQNVQCLNEGVCRSSFLNYTCECLTQSYSGRHCQILSSEIIVLQRLCKSFASIAIIAMLSVVVLIVTMDVMKYAFGIPPPKQQLKQLKKKKKRTIMIIRYLYVHSSSSTIEN